ncbi:MAG: type IV pilin protein [Steroidobacteraceae bacterium]
MRGVTLIELLVCTVVLAILAALAIPGYRTHVLRAQRSDARGALLRVLGNEERHFLQHGRYTADLVAPPEAGGLGMAQVTELQFYELSIRLTGDGYVASAMPLGRQRDDTGCASFSIDERGTRTAMGSDPQATSHCWR